MMHIGTIPRFSQQVPTNINAKTTSTAMCTSLQTLLKHTLLTTLIVPALQCIWMANPCCSGGLVRVACTTRVVVQRRITPTRCTFLYPGNCDNDVLGVPPGQDPAYTHPAFRVVIMDNHMSGRRQGILDAACRNFSDLWVPEWTFEQMLADANVFMCKYGVYVRSNIRFHGVLIWCTLQSLH